MDDTRRDIMRFATILNPFFWARKANLKDVLRGFIEYSRLGFRPVKRKKTGKLPRETIRLFFEHPSSPPLIVEVPDIRKQRIKLTMEIPLTEALETKISNFDEGDIQALHYMLGLEFSMYKLRVRLMPEDDDGKQIPSHALIEEDLWKASLSTHEFLSVCRAVLDVSKLVGTLFRLYGRFADHNASSIVMQEDQRWSLFT